MERRPKTLARPGKTGLFPVKFVKITTTDQGATAYISRINILINPGRISKLQLLIV